MSPSRSTSVPSESHRIAVIWPDHRLQALRTFSGLCQRAGLSPEVTLQSFDALHLGFQRGILKPLLRWRPDGVVARMDDWDQLKRLRQALPRVPVVSPLVVPPELADTCVTSDITDAITLARDHFLERGVPRVAMFCSALPYAAAPRMAAFRAAVPDGYDLEYPWGDRPGGPKVVMDWLKSLPKPVGVMALEIGAGPFLLGCCQRAGLEVPLQVQIIGTDDDDVALACQPHLTSLQLPGDRIGEAVMDAMLHHLRQASPPPPAMLHVGGSILAVRGSTGLAPSGASCVARAVRLMNAHLRDGLTMNRLATLSGVGLTTFYKEFEAAMGCTPARYMRDRRMEEARRMLRETPATVTAIARECGFKSLIAFVQFFRRETGTTPTAYRKKQS